MGTLINIIGKTFGRWTVLTFSHTNKNNKRCYICKCLCGTVKCIDGSTLRSGNSTSCGCLKIEKLIKRSKTHGLSESQEFNIWRNIIQRCYNKKHKYYYNYGGRGIRVCERWRHSFSNFFKDMGRRPSKNHSIDRIDNNKNYGPENCKWSTRKEQSRNSRHNKLLSLNGRTKTVVEWSEIIGINCHIIYDRIRRGWTAKEALTPSGRKSITFDGQTKTLTGWSKTTGLSHSTLSRRLQRGWTIKDTLTRPVGSQGPKPK